MIKEKPIKRVYLFMPAQGRTIENIQRSLGIAKKIIEAMYGENQVLFVEHDFSSIKDLKSLVKQIEPLSQADALITIDAPWWMEPDDATQRFLEDTWRSFNRENPASMIQLPISCIMTKEELDELYSEYEAKHSDKCICGEVAGRR